MNDFKNNILSCQKSVINVAMQHTSAQFKEAFLKVERWAESGLFHDNNCTSKYHIHNSSALWFDMELYWKLCLLTFEGNHGLKVKFWIKST